MNKSINEHRNIFMQIFESYNVVILKMAYDDIYTQHNKERKCDEKIKIKLPSLLKSIYKFYENQNIKVKPCQFISPSREYYKNTIFREKIDRLVSALDAELYVNLTTDIHHLVSDTSSLKKVHTLTLSNCLRLTNVKHLSKLHTLTLDSCNNSIDLSPLKNLNKLTVLHCKNARGINMLGEINELNLNGSTNMLTNINSLKNVQKLNISGSPHITDVSDLKNVHTLSMKNCNNVVDVSDLGNVYDLDIGSCDGITNISNLRNVHKLDISYCKNILHTDSLQHVKHLIISRHHVKYLPHGLTKVCVKGLEKYSRVNNLPSTITYLEVNGIFMCPLLYKHTNIKLK